MGRFTATTGVAALVLALAACGGDGDGGGDRDSQTTEGKAYVDAMMATYDPSMGFDEQQGRCIAELAIDTIGVSTLKDAGITPEDMDSGDSLLADYQPTEAQADSLIDGMFECIDFGELMVSQMGSTDISIPDDKVKCIGQAMADSSAFRDSLKADMLGVESTSSDTDIETAIFAIFDSCEVDFADLMGG